MFAYPSIQSKLEISVEQPYTFSDEFSRPISPVRNFMDQMGYDFSCKYPINTGPDVEFVQNASRVITHKGRKQNAPEEFIELPVPEIREGIFELDEEGRYLHFDELNNSYDSVQYIGKRKDKDAAAAEFKYLSVCFVKLADSMTPRITPTEAEGSITIEDFMKSLKFDFEREEIVPDGKYKRYTGRNNDGNEVWVTFYN